MKARMLLLTLALCFAGTAASFAQSPQMGTWKLDEAKSKMTSKMQAKHICKRAPSTEKKASLLLLTVFKPR